MKKLSTFIAEEKNLHMEHIEDLILNDGVAGAKQIFNFLSQTRDLLGGKTTKKIAATVKWDGAPAIFAGVDPRDGKFFVAKKGIFNKNPKIDKTQADIDGDLSGELAAKFSVALREFKKLGITKGVFQGDLMFTKGDVRAETIDGNKYYTFQPNTIVYAVPIDSVLGKTISKASIGVVWHTTYEGDSFESMRASFGKGIVEKLKQVGTIWMDDANYKDVSGSATFTAAETEAFNKILSQAGTILQRLPDADYMNDYYQKEEDKKKTPAGKASVKTKKMQSFGPIVSTPLIQLKSIFDFMNLIVDAKMMVVSKMNSAAAINTFLRTRQGLKVTSPEGYVAVDHLTGGAVKLVDRLGFSQANFSPDIIKGWER